MITSDRALRQNESETANKRFRAKIDKPQKLRFSFCWHFQYIWRQVGSGSQSEMGVICKRFRFYVYFPVEERPDYMLHEGDLKWLTRDIRSRIWAEHRVLYRELCFSISVAKYFNRPFINQDNTFKTAVFALKFPGLLSSATTSNRHAIRLHNIKFQLAHFTFPTSLSEAHLKTRLEFTWVSDAGSDQVYEHLKSSNFSTTAATIVTPLKIMLEYLWCGSLSKFQNKIHVLSQRII